MHLFDYNSTCLSAPGQWAVARLLESGNGPTSVVESRHTEPARGHAATWDGRQARLISKQIKNYSKRVTISNLLQSCVFSHQECVHQEGGIKLPKDRK